MSWTVPREWAGETCFILGGGPSLRTFDAAVLRGRRVIAINRSYRMAPWADVLYFCDRTFWQTESAEILSTFHGKYIVTIGVVSNPIVHRLLNTGPCGLELIPTGLRHGSNSGCQSINLAVHFGARRIVLLGFDQKLDGARTHWHDGYGISPEIVSHVLAKRMLPYFSHMVEPLASAGVEVLNANLTSAIECWPRVTLESILNESAQM